MAKILASDLVSEFQTMHKEHWDYVWGHHEKGTVDCSGAFVYAYKQHGLSIYNGSNRIARVYISGSLIPYAEAKSKGLIVPGMAAFKAYDPNNANWKLKSTYMPGGQYYNGDTNDYHHIGLIDEDTRYVLNAQGAKTGFVRSPITQNWSHVALLKDVEYNKDEGGDVQMPNGTVTGGKLKLRQDPSTSAKVIDSIPDGARINVISQNNGWSIVEYAGKTGYCMSEFIIMDGETPDIPVQDDAVTIKLSKQHAIALRDALIDALGVG